MPVMIDMNHGRPAKPLSERFATFRVGVTLIEVLVAISIIGLLAGLTIPAILAARMAAKRTECLSHLQQIGVAFANRNSERGALPMGVVSPSNGSSMPFVGWTTQLLPWLGEATLWDRTVAAYAENRDFLASPTHNHRGTVLKVFSCPTDGRTREMSTRWGKLGVAFTSYLGVSGTNYRSKNGTLFVDSHVRIVDIVDGLSTTLLVGERPPSANERLGWWYAGWGLYKDGSAELVLGVRELNDAPLYHKCPPGPYEFRAGNLTDNCDLFHYWSPHTGGAHFLFADCSGRFLTYSADKVLPALATRAGGEAVTVPD